MMMSKYSSLYRPRARSNAFFLNDLRLFFVDKYIAQSFVMPYMANTSKFLKGVYYYFFLLTSSMNSTCIVVTKIV